jgi:predicted nucleic acid-binding protein
MIILDTNIISELMKTAPSRQVITWIDQQDAMTLFITSITVAEITYGLNALTASKRRDYLEDAFGSLLAEGFKHRVVVFDEPAAHIYGKLMAHRKTLGRPLSILDGQIAAISGAHQMSLATRNTRDFVDCELNIINPFQ